MRAFFRQIPHEKQRQSILVFSVAIVIIIADQLTKFFVRANMQLYESIPAEGRFRLSYSTNSGSVFGLDLDSTFLLVMAPIVIIAILSLYFFYLPAAGKLIRIGFGLLLGGAFGNLIDRVRDGAVTDFIDVRLWGNYHWPSFNVADAAITTGIVIFVYYFLREARNIK